MGQENALPYDSADFDPAILAASIFKQGAPAASDGEPSDVHKPPHPGAPGTEGKNLP